MKLAKTLTLLVVLIVGISLVSGEEDCQGCSEECTVECVDKCPSICGGVELDRQYKRKRIYHQKKKKGKSMKSKIMLPTMESVKKVTLYEKCFKKKEDFVKAKQILDGCYKDGTESKAYPNKNEFKSKEEACKIFFGRAYIYCVVPSWVRDSCVVDRLKFYNSRSKEIDYDAINKFANKLTPTVKAKFNKKIINDCKAKAKNFNYDKDFAEMHKRYITKYSCKVSDMYKKVIQMECKAQTFFTCALKSLLNGCTNS